MDLIPFILAYFASKKVVFLTAFLCWKPEEIWELHRGAQSSGIKLRVRTGSRFGDELLAYDVYREGVLMDVSCNYIGLLLQQASSSRAFNHRHSWLLLDNSSFNFTKMESTLADSLILPDADVVWWSRDLVMDVYRVKSGEPLWHTLLHLNRNSTQRELEMLWGSLRTNVARRRNLHGITISSATIISQPQYFKGWTDLTNRQIDTFPKLSYPLMLLLAEDLNFRYNLRQVDLYGEEQNGSFDGLAGMLQRGRIEIGITSMFMRNDRWRVLHFSSETVELRGAFIFRQPSKSAVSNVFALPFSGGVWAASAVVFGTATLLLTLLSKQLRSMDPDLGQLTPLEAVTFAIGTICQQGTYVTPHLASIRLVMFCTLLSSVFTFTAYSAKIVVILQTPSNAIQTIDDLTRSPMSLGVQETTYKRVYFAESNEPSTQRLYVRKLLPLGERAYLSVVDGVAKLRTQFFAFQVEQASGYDIISKTFTEREKCGLKEIEAFRLPVVAVPIRKHSGYRDLIATRLRWQREVGLMEQAKRRWLAAKPRCEAGSGGFLSVGLTDVLPAIHVLAAGILLATLSLLLEILSKRVHSRRYAFLQPSVQLKSFKLKSFT